MVRVSSTAAEGDEVALGGGAPHPFLPWHLPRSPCDGHCAHQAWVRDMSQEWPWPQELRNTSREHEQEESIFQEKCSRRCIRMQRKVPVRGDLSRAVRGGPFQRRHHLSWDPGLSSPGRKGRIHGAETSAEQRDEDIKVSPEGLRPGCRVWGWEEKQRKVPFQNGSTWQICGSVLFLLSSSSVLSCSVVSSFLKGSFYMLTSSCSSLEKTWPLLSPPMMHRRKALD